jgi:hypothetical protein
MLMKGGVYIIPGGQRTNKIIIPQTLVGIWQEKRASGEDERDENKVVEIMHETVEAKMQERKS